MTESDTQSQPTEPLLSLNEIIFGEYRDSQGTVTTITAADVMAARLGYATTQVLGQRIPFTSDDAMRKFVDSIPDLSPWRHSIPDATSVRSRVSLVVSSLINKRRSDGRYALEIFLRNLAKPENLLT